ncbi:MAG: hypothetical protein ACK5Y2_10125 [Bdellovibrionales bacterium]
MEQIPVFSLFTWPPGASDSLSHLILRLKKASPAAWRFYAEHFFLQWAQSNPISDSAVFVSVESRSGNLHAQNWGQALSDYFQKPHEKVLALEGDLQSQKTLELEGRQRRRMICRVDFSRLRGRQLIFVDDVVTSGSTALAAYRALKEPKDFQVWSLVWRSVSSIAVSQPPW